MILVLGLVLRLAIAAATYHPDVGIINFTSAVILRAHNLNPYDTEFRKIIFGKEAPDDLPLQYWLRVPIEFFLRPLINVNTEDQFLLDMRPLLGKVEFNLHLLAVKMPLVIFDLVTGILLTLAVAPALRRKTLLLWMINLVTLWATAAVGQVDIMPTLFVVLSLVLLQKQKNLLAALSLGVGGAIKSFPFLLAPFLIFTAKSWAEKVKMAGIMIVPLTLSVLPYLGSANFRHEALFAPQLDKMLYAKLPLSGGEALIISVVLLLALYLIYLLKKRTSEDFLAFSTATILIVLAFTHFHIQWFLWVTPLLIIYAVRGIKAAEGFSFGLIGLGVLLMLFLFEASLQVQLFAPLFPELAKAKGLAEMLRPEQVDFGKNLAASFFAAGALFFSGSLLSRYHFGEEPS